MWFPNAAAFEWSSIALTWIQGAKRSRDARRAGMKNKRLNITSHLGQELAIPAGKFSALRTINPLVSQFLAQHSRWEGAAHADNIASRLCQQLAHPTANETSSSQNGYLGPWRGWREGEERRGCPTRDAGLKRDALSSRSNARACGEW